MGVRVGYIYMYDFKAGLKLNIQKTKIMASPHGK